MKAIIIMVIHESNPATGYVIGLILALAIFGYLVYSLAKPDKF
jgi:K+-transporting ATPase KdpF subunit